MQIIRLSLTPQARGAWGVRGWIAPLLGHRLRRLALRARGILVALRLLAVARGDTPMTA